MKRTRRTLVLLLLTAVFLTLPALAATPGYSTGSVSYDAATGKFTATYDGAQAGTEYTLLVVEGTKTFYSIRPERIQFLEQKTADSGTVSFSFIPMSYVAGDKTKTCVVLLTWTGSATPVMLGTLDGNSSGAVVTGSVNCFGSVTKPVVKLVSASGTTYTATVGDVSGNLADYTIIGVPEGNYSLTVTKEGHLPYASAVDVNGDTVLPRATLLGGDVDGDRGVTLTDISEVLTYFGKLTTELAPAKKAVDIDQDGGITLTDLSITLTNFGR